MLWDVRAQTTTVSGVDRSLPIRLTENVGKPRKHLRAKICGSQLFGTVIDQGRARTVFVSRTFVGMRKEA